MLGFITHLKIRSRFALLGLVGLIMTAIPMALYVNAAWSELRKAQIESQGVAPAKALLRVIQLTQQHRGLSALVLGGNTASQDARAKKQAEIKALGIIARVRAHPGTKPAILIELHGDTYQIKDAAKERGYSFGALHAGSNIIFAVLGSEKESKGWMLSIDVRGNLEDAAQKLAAEIEWIKSIPNLNAEKSSWLSPADMEYLRVGLRRQQEKSDAEPLRSPASGPRW